MTSPFGTARLSLDACDADMYLARPSETDIHDQWRIAPWVLPWLYSVRIRSDAIVFNSDRGRDVALTKLP